MDEDGWRRVESATSGGDTTRLPPAPPPSPNLPLAALAAFLHLLNDSSDTSLAVLLHNSTVADQQIKKQLPWEWYSLPETRVE